MIKLTLEIIMMNHGQQLTYSKKKIIIIKLNLWKYIFKMAIGIIPTYF